MVAIKATAPPTKPFITAPITPDEPRSAMTPPVNPATRAVLPRIENAINALKIGNNRVPIL